MNKYISLILAGALTLALGSCSNSADTETPETSEIPVITATEPPAEVAQLSYGIAISNSSAFDFDEIYAIDPDSAEASENLLAGTLYEWTSTTATLTGAFTSNVFDIELVFTDGTRETISNVTINDGTNLDITEGDSGLVIATY